MFVKTLSTVAAVAIGAVSLHAFADQASAPAAQVAMAPGNLLAKPERQLVNKAQLAWPKGVEPYREAKVVLRYTIEADGSVDHVEAVFAPVNPAFAEAARDAVSRWTYAPSAQATENVEAVAYFHAARS
jgi:TonB family protein